MTDISLDLFKAYYNARKSKRNTINQLKFEYRFESNLLALNDEIMNRTYQPHPQVAFIVNKPVKREIFAADFRDRVVHHLLFNYLNPIMEKYFINDCYSCRKGKGTSYGIKRVNGFIKACSKGWKQDCYVLKLDIQGYFMGINRSILYQLIGQILEKEKTKNAVLPFDEDMVNYLLQTIIFNDPTIGCRIKSNRHEWDGLPNSKSLFYASPDCGLPIGNITSQLFGNIYMTVFDQFVKRELGIHYYGRYVDDFVLIHRDKNHLNGLIPFIRRYLWEKLKLTLHPKKIYLQHYTRGLKFLGVVIKPHRIYIASRTKGSFYAALARQNKIAGDHKPTPEEQLDFISRMNSYLGIMQHYRTYKLRKRLIIKNLSAWWWVYAYTVGFRKFVLRKKPINLRTFVSGLFQIVVVF